MEVAWYYTRKRTLVYSRINVGVKLDTRDQEQNVDSVLSSNKWVNREGQLGA